MTFVEKFWQNRFPLVTLAVSYHKDDLKSLDKDNLYDDNLYDNLHDNLYDNLYDNLKITYMISHDDFLILYFQVYCVN